MMSKSLLISYARAHQLNKLTQLDLSGNEKIKEIPPGACGKMKRLRQLYMGRCGLTCLPEDLDQMVNLETLIHRWNSLSHLCNGLKNMTKLTWVDLGNNPFESLEEELTMPPSMTNLCNVQPSFVLTLLPPPNRRHY